MSHELDIPDLTIPVTIPTVTVEGGSSGLLEELPDEYRFSWSYASTSNPAQAQFQLRGEVVVSRAELEALNAGKPLAQMPQRALIRNTLGLLKPKIKTQIQDLFKKEPAP